MVVLNVAGVPTTILNKLPRKLAQAAIMERTLKCLKLMLRLQVVRKSAKNAGRTASWTLLHAFAANQNTHGTAVKSAETRKVCAGRIIVSGD